MKINTKRRLTYVTIALFNFFTGVEYAVIFPSLWGFISERYNAAPYMMGMIIAAFSLSGLFSNPIVGKFADRFPNTRLILMFTNIGEIVGCFMYFMGISTWFLVLSRLVCGIGVGGGAAIMADITKSTPEDSRTGILSFVMATRQFGLLIGPAFNFLFLPINYHLGPFILDKYTAPGLFMTAVWIILEFFIIFMYFNLTALQREETLDQHLSVDYSNVSTVDGRNFRDSLRSTSGSAAMASGSSYLWNQSVSPQVPLSEDSLPTTNAPSIKPKPILDTEPNIMIESAEQFIISASVKCAPTLVVSCPQNNTNDQIEDTNNVNDWQRSSSQEELFVRKSVPLKESLQGYAKEYLRDEVVVLLGLVFASVSAQTSLEAIVTPLTKEIFNYEEFENSLIYLIAGVQTLVVFFAINYLSKKMTDRTLLLIGQITLCAALIWFIIFVPSAKANDYSALPYFVIGCMLDLIAIPILIVCSASLLTKVTSVQNQALTHGLRRSVMSIACVIGPLWGGAFLKYRYVLYAVPLGISVLFMILFCISFKDLLPKRNEVPKISNIDVNNERNFINNNVQRNV